MMYFVTQQSDELYGEPYQFLCDGLHGLEVFAYEYDCDSLENENKLQNRLYELAEKSKESGELEQVHYHRFYYGVVAIPENLDMGYMHIKIKDE